MWCCGERVRVWGFRPAGRVGGGGMHKVRGAVVGRVEVGIHMAKLAHTHYNTTNTYHTHITQKKHVDLG